MKISELLYGKTLAEAEEEGWNPHYVEPGSVPSFAGRRAPNKPKKEIDRDWNPHHVEPGSVPSFVGRRAHNKPDENKQIDELGPDVGPNQDWNPHFVQPGSVPSFAGSRAPNKPTPMAPTPPGKMKETAKNRSKSRQLDELGPDVGPNQDWNPHFVQPGSVPSFAGSRAPNKPTPMAPTPQPGVLGKMSADTLPQPVSPMMPDRNAMMPSSNTPKSGPPGPAPSAPNSPTFQAPNKASV
jgi:hypothetical protein